MTFNTSTRHKSVHEDDIPALSTHANNEFRYVALFNKQDCLFFNSNKNRSSTNLSVWHFKDPIRSMISTPQGEVIMEQKSNTDFNLNGDSGFIYELTGKLDHLKIVFELMSSQKKPWIRVVLGKVTKQQYTELNLRDEGDFVYKGRIDETHELEHELTVQPHFSIDFKGNSTNFLNNSSHISV